MESENFMWAPTAATLLGRVQGEAIKLKDNWDPADPDARPPPKVFYRADRFDVQNNVVFQVTRRVPNDRCYYCHTNVDAGRGDAGQTSLESRWNHDRDIHLIKGMLCSDCHRNGVDHMTVRGYEGEEHRLALLQGLPHGHGAGSRQRHRAGRAQRRSPPAAQGPADAPLR
jgi:hypothetical protein